MNRAHLDPPRRNSLQPMHCSIAASLTRFGGTILWLIAGCGEVTAVSTPGTPSVVSITSIAPADGASRVGALTPVTIALSGEIDAGSVTAQSVRLLVGDSKLAVHGDVVYSASPPTITFTPTGPLQRGKRYRLEAAGITAGDGAVAPVTSRFQIRIDPEIYTTTFSNNSGATSRDLYETDADGNRTADTLVDPGPDGMYGTSDDVIENWWATVAVSATTRRFVTYAGPGPDNVWRTADDVVASYSDTVTSSSGPVQTISYSLGPDGKAFTADDRVTTYSNFVYLPDDRPAAQVAMSAGPDGRIGTADDTIQAWARYVYQTGARSDLASDVIVYTAPGPDGLWQTADDVSTSFTHFVYDARGLSVTSVSLDNGPDGLPNTADDTTSGIVQNDCDALGQLTRVTIYDAPGSDGTWGTADDHVLVYHDRVFRDGDLTTDTNFDAGADGRAATADDREKNVTVYDPSR